MEEAHAYATEIVRGLCFSALIADPGLLPEDHQAQIPAEGLARTVADYSPAMTDSYIDTGVAALRRGVSSLNRFLYFTGRNSICAKSATALKS